MPLTVDTVATGDPAVNGILHDDHYIGPVITYSFPAYASLYESSHYHALPGFEPLNNAQRNAVRETFDLIEEYTLVRFAEMTERADSHATLRLAQTDIRETYRPDGTIFSKPITTATAFNPSETPLGGDVFFNPDDFDTPSAGNFDQMTFYHEIGHAIGLEHSHENTDFGTTPTAYDHMSYTVMSYRMSEGAPIRSARADGYAETFMMIDIAALQHLYGADFTTNAGDTTYLFRPTEDKIFRTIWDGNGTDTYDFRLYSTDLRIDLNPGLSSDTNAGQTVLLNSGYVSGGEAPVYAEGNVFNALLYNGDTRSLIENALGGSGNDTISGNQAANLLNGNGGNDTIHGLGGSDTLYGLSGGDNIFGGLGRDRIFGGEDNDALRGEEDGDRIYGGSGNDDLFGGEGNDLLDGGTGSDEIRGGLGRDVILGRDGADDLFGDEEGDKIYGHQGADIVKGGGGNDFIRGGDDGDLLFGDEGRDAIFGDAGNDELHGGAEGDSLYGQAGLDSIYGGDGNDLIKGGADRDALFGDTGRDAIYGEDGDDVIRGGSGDDSLFGMDGLDDIYGDDGDDRLKGGVGADDLYGGNDNDILIGESGDDKLFGEAGNDLLLGGIGSNILNGGIGDDVFRFQTNDETNVIEDFTKGEDIIDMRAFGFTSYQDFLAGTDQFSVSGTGRYVTIDGNGSFSILLSGFSGALEESDFALF
ncbi:M10 family metallopeptidase C-terminal domain-containing protein [Pseudahrensia aquimaris]|uniref:M10 family metallopeptidase C-terminal domain-containing protein n=1 Tax=Pseudahrensia aquimaris TaxID=744461 RepID=A0ABW3FDW5_9HYPH